MKRSIDHAESQDVPSTNVSHVETMEREDNSLLTTGASKSHIPHPNKKPRHGRRYIVKGPKRRAEYWNDYELFLDDQDNVRAECVHCDSSFAADSAKNGTKNLKLHHACCEKNPINKGKDKGETIAEEIKAFAKMLFAEYRMIYAPSNVLSGESSIFSPSASLSKGGSLDLMYSISEQVKMKMRGDTGTSGSNKFLRTEFDRYLDEIMGDDEEKDILIWWKLNEARFPVVARMARDILAIPVSTVASESAFSAGGRHLDQFRSSLTPKMVQALICGQDWIHAHLRKPKLDMEENLEQLEKIEKDLKNANIDDDLIFVTE